jgi:hypothetical protein
VGIGDPRGLAGFSSAAATAAAAVDDGGGGAKAPSDPAAPLEATPRPAALQPRLEPPPRAPKPPSTRAVARRAWCAAVARAADEPPSRGGEATAAGHEPFAAKRATAAAAKRATAPLGGAALPSASLGPFTVRVVPVDGAFAVAREVFTLAAYDHHCFEDDYHDPVRARRRERLRRDSSAR